MLYEVITSYREFAVLVRTHQQLTIMSEVFEQEGIPFQIASRQNVIKRRGLPELISVLKILEGYVITSYSIHYTKLYETR